MPPVWNWYEAFLMRFQFARCLIGKFGFRFESREKYPWISFLSVLLRNPKKDLKLGSSQDLQFRTPNAISEKGPNKLGFKNETVKKKNPSNLDEDFFIEIHLKSVFRFWVLLHNPQSVLQINPDLLIGIILYFAQERASGRFWSTGVCFQTIAFWAIDYVVLHVSYPLFYLFCFCCYCFDCIERATIMDVITIMSIFCLKRHLKRIRKSYKISV